MNPSIFKEKARVFLLFHILWSGCDVSHYFRIDSKPVQDIKLGHALSYVNVFTYAVLSPFLDYVKLLN